MLVIEKVTGNFEAANDDVCVPIRPALKDDSLSDRGRRSMTTICITVPHRVQRIAKQRQKRAKRPQTSPRISTSRIQSRFDVPKERWRLRTLGRLIPRGPSMTVLRCAYASNEASMARRSDLVPWATLRHDY